MCVMKKKPKRRYKIDVYRGSSDFTIYYNMRGTVFIFCLVPKTDMERGWWGWGKNWTDISQSGIIYGEVVKMKNNLRGGRAATESNQNYYTLPLLSFIGDEDDDGRAIKITREIPSTMSCRTPVNILYNIHIISYIYIRTFTGNKSFFFFLWRWWVNRKNRYFGPCGGRVEKKILNVLFLIIALPPPFVDGSPWKPTSMRSSYKHPNAHYALVEDVRMHMYNKLILTTMNVCVCINVCNGYYVIQL